MATLTASACQTGSNGFLNPPRYNANGVTARSVEYTFTAAQSAGDVIRMVPTCAGMKVLDVSVWVNGKAAGADFVLNGIGDGNATTRFNAASASGSAVVRMTSSLGYTYTADDTIDVVIGTVTSATAGGTIRMACTYHFEDGA